MAFESYRLYHYRPDIKPRDLNTLLARQLWSSTIDRLNDPFEFIALRELKAFPNKLEQFKSAGLTCFCRALTHILPRLYYADGHLGFAIGIDSAHPFFGGDKGMSGRFLHDVRYEEAPTLERFSVDDLPMMALTTKPASFVHEQEVRMIKQAGNQPFQVPHDAIREIVFGARMPAQRINEITQALQTAGIKAKLARMEFVDRGYGVNPRWITQAPDPPR
jgi:hypothetical protein